MYGRARSTRQRLDLGRQQWARVFRAIHRILSVKMSWDNGKEIKARISEASQHQIRKAAKAGVAVSSRSNNGNRLRGDTAIDVLKGRTGSHACVLFWKSPF